MPPAPESEGAAREEEEMDVAAGEEETQQPPKGKGKGKGKGRRKRADEEEQGDEEGARPSKKRQSEGSVASAAASSEDGGGSVGNGSAREESSNEDEYEYDDEDADLDDKFFDPRKQINKFGQSAEAGVIVKIYCENFMCHRKLSVVFCPNVNFINGQNGSGKSAILAALQICLGARANVTHRGSKLSDLIRQGHNGAAIVRVTLLNKGTDAFKPQTYGDYITVERKIERNGSSSYALLKGNPHSDSPKYTTVSKSKEELVSVLDAFNIQIDNPCALLDQENAKRFIQGGEEEKYKFFEKATDIERVKRCIAATKDRLARADQQLQIQNRQLPLVEKTWLDLQKLREEMESLERIEEDIQKARVDCAWVYHHENLEQTQAIAAGVATLEKQVKKITAEIEKAEALLKEKSEASRGLDNEAAALKEQLKDAKQTMKELKRQSQSLKEQVRDKDEEVRAKTEEIKRALKSKKEAQKKMDAERAKLASQAEADIGSKVERVREIEEELEAAMAEREGLKQGYAALAAEREGLVEKDKQIRDQIERIQKGDLRRLEREKQELSKAQGELAGYGPQIAQLCQEIARNASKFDAPPLGPLGRHVKIKDDAQQWAGPVENAIGNSIGHFVVGSHKDRQLLQDMCVRLKCHWVTIITMRPNQQKHRVREPNARGVRSAAQCVTVEQPLVWNALVDWAKIDTSGVFRDHHEAYATLSVNNHGHKVFPFPIKSGYHLDDFQTDVMRGNVTVRPISGAGSARRKLGVDRSEMIRGVEAEIAKVKEVLQLKMRQQKDGKARFNEVNQEMRKIQGDKDRLDGQIRNLRGEKEELDEEIREAQAAATGNSATQAAFFDDLQEELDAADEEIKAAQDAQAAIKEQKRLLEEELEPLLQKEKNEEKRNKELNKKVLNEEAKVESILNEAEDAAKAVRKLKKALEAAEKELEKKSGELETAEEADAKNLIKVQEYTRKIMPDWDGQDRNPDKSADELKKDITRMEKRKEREAQRHATSDSVDVIREKERRAKQAFVRMGRDIGAVKKDIKDLKEALGLRETKLRVLRKFIIRRSTVCFDMVLQHRGQSGGLEFDIKHHQLGITVQKDNRDETTQSNNVRELSGGERSFTTLALLLALGESIESPFRAMDEFDIFMDAVARKVALGKLIETARSEQMRHRQFIFITPQDLSAVQKYVGDDFKIHKMRPPERADRGLQQTTLN